MIIESVLSVLLNVFTLLLSVVDIPELPAGAVESIESIGGYIASGLAILNNFLDLNYLLVLLGLVIAVDVGLLAYRTVMWFIRKIPFLGIK